MNVEQALPTTPLAEQALPTEQLPSWHDVPELFEQRTPAFSELRQQVLAHVSNDSLGRLAVHPDKTPDEQAFGVIREQLEPQCRDAVFGIYNKGYQTFNSGFGPGDLQVLDGNFSSLSLDTVHDLERNGFMIFETKPGSASIAFKPETPDIDHLTEK